MHRSRIGVVLVDHPEGAADAGLAFWAGVQGVTPVAEDSPEYHTIGTVGSLSLAAQRTGAGTPARVHLDIETDDVPAEVARVVALGATVVEQRRSHTILQDPAGVVFCVVPIQTGDDFEREALTWHD
jgi:hypothetical protein